jgi:hypothetical protein
MSPMYLDAMEFLEEEREAWRPYEALLDLTDEQLERPVEAAHGWSGRDLMVHLLGWLDTALAVAKELAVREDSPTLERREQGMASPGVDAINEDLQASGRERSLEELRDAFRTVPGELRGYLTVVPEARWIKNPAHLKPILGDTTDHYEEHAPDLAAILEASR